MKSLLITLSLVGVVMSVFFITVLWGMPFLDLMVGLAMLIPMYTVFVSLPIWLMCRLIVYVEGKI
jgi:hypothetical protein